MGPAWGQPAREHAHSLARSPRLTHFRDGLVCVCVCAFFWKGDGGLTSTVGDTVQILVCVRVSFSLCMPTPPTPAADHLLMHIYPTALQSMNERSVNT